MAHRRQFASRVLPGLIVVVAAWVVYFNSLGNGFVYDDHFVLLQNDAVRQIDLFGIFGAEYWKGFAQDGSGTYYRPLTVLSLALDYAVWADNPFGYHLTNVFLHGLTTLLVFLLCRRLLRRAEPALFAALLFAVHPVHTEAVAHILGRSDLLFGLFGVTSLFLFVQNGWFSRFGTAVAVLFSLCAKETALVLPFLLLFCDLIWRPAAAGGLVSFLWRRVKSHHIWVLAVLGLFLMFRMVAVGNLRLVAPSPLDNPLINEDLAVRLMTLPVVGLHYARLLAFPGTLSVEYGFNQIPVVTAPLNGSFLFAAASMVAVGFVLARCWRRCRIGMFGAALLAFPLALSLNPLFPSGSILSERYLYFPSAGFCLVLGLVALRLRPSWMSTPIGRKIAVGLAVLLLGAGTWRTIIRNRDWHSDETLFQSAVAESPRSVRAHLNLASVLESQGDFLRAVFEYHSVLTIKADYPIVHYRLADAYWKLQEPKKALSYYLKAVRLKPTFVEAWTALGQAYMGVGNPGDAEKAFKTALSLSPDLAQLHNTLGVIYQRRGDLRGAHAAYERAISGNYRHPGVFCNLGAVYAQEGRNAEARKAFETALRLKPDLAIAHYHIANLLRAEGDAALAIQHYQAFLKYWDSDPRTRDQVEQTIRSLDPSA